MSTISEIEKAVPKLSAQELAKLERLIRKTRCEREGKSKPTLRDIKPVSVGKILRPFGTRDEWYDEMREARV